MSFRPADHMNRGAEVGATTDVLRRRKWGGQDGPLGPPARMAAFRRGRTSVVAEDRSGVTMLLLFFAIGCRQDMHDQPRYEPFEATQFFTDGRSVRPQVEGTVARGELRLDQHLYTGLIAGRPAETFPFAIEKSDMERGRERYDIYCSPCHGELGDGLGMVANSSFTRFRSHFGSRSRIIRKKRLREASSNCSTLCTG